MFCNFPPYLELKSTLNYPAGSSSLGDIHILEANFPLEPLHIYSPLQNTDPKPPFLGYAQDVTPFRSLFTNHPGKFTTLTLQDKSPPYGQKHSSYHRCSINATEKNKSADEKERIS